MKLKLPRRLKKTFTRSRPPYAGWEDMPSALLALLLFGSGLPAWYWLKGADQYGWEVTRLINQHGWHPLLVGLAILLLGIAIVGLCFAGVALRCMDILRRRWIK